MLYEIWKIPIRIGKIEDNFLKWENETLAVREDKGIQFFHFTHNVQSLCKELTLNVSFLPHNNNSPAIKLFPKHFLRNGMTNLDYTQLLINSKYWPHSMQLTKEMTAIHTVMWSPCDMTDNECILAVLNNVGGVKMFLYQGYSWECLVDLSSSLKECYEDSLISDLKSFQDLKKNVDMVETSAICWGQKYENNSCYFVTGQQNGDILVWNIRCNSNDTIASLIVKIPTEFGELRTIVWIENTKTHFTLIVSNDLGQMYALNCEILSTGVKFLNTHCLWKHQDRMVPNYIYCKKVQDKTILLCNKYRHLVVLQLNEDCNVASQVVKNINDYKISNILWNNDSFYLSTINNMIYKVNLFVNECLNVDLSLVKFKDVSSTHELYSFSISPNNLIWVLATVDRKVDCRKKVLSLDLTFYCDNIQIKDVLNLLLNNPTKKLTNYWDCVELLRYKVIKQKQMPDMDFNQLYTECNSDMYKLKLYLILVTLHNSIEKMLRNGPKPELPETSIDVVKENILVLYSTKLIMELYDISKNNTLSVFELETFVATKKYLETYCKKNNRFITEFIDADMLSVSKLSYSYTCQCCDENIDGMTCKYGHLNMFCSLTFTPIESDNYLVCKGCNATARFELFSNKPMCLFCDLPLIKAET